MFHEPYFYFGWQHPARNALAVVQREMARRLMRASRVAYFSTESWGPYLTRWAAAGTRIVVSPIPSTIPPDASPEEIVRWRSRFVDAHAGAPVIGHFGTYGDHVAGELREALPMLLGLDPQLRLACIGHGSVEFVRSLPQFAGRMVGTGSLSPTEVAAALRACDMALQPYPDGVTTRRTSVMAALANGVPTVTTRGALTERVWNETAAVRIVPAGDPHALAEACHVLLRDDKARTALGLTGQQAYDARFAVRHAVRALLDPADVEPVRASAGHETVVPHR
jgi:glycosyltransferase involved in cell wall biosynthesis